MTQRGCAIAVMAKAPRAGQVKTRLTPPLSADAARAMSAAFLRDVTENIHAAGVAGYVAFAPAGLEHLFDGMLADGTGLVLADGSGDMPPSVQGFGRSLLHAARALIDRGHASACLLNADSPTLPTALLAQAAAALAAPGERVVLGPAEDGGYYLIGMQAPHAELFADIAWSTQHVAAATRDRVRALGLELVELAPWYDVDDRAALRRLLAELRAPAVGRFAAAATAACVRQLGLDALLDEAAA